MDTNAVKKYCRAYPGADESLHGAPSNILVYSVGGKFFAYFKTSEPERWRFSFKTSSDRFLELTGIPGVKTARFMGRYHWVTVVDVRSLPAEYLRELIDWSYRRALGNLSRKRQAEALADASQAQRLRLTPIAPPKARPRLLAQRPPVHRVRGRS
ncbi:MULTISPECIES: MmcQ/YjbR family DNA-binding protein [unclassified Lysobacter]|uniref:MmcQ/YjbR family DNA-binding protein n=1 Tax=unclassified Lysobacter TaxID=2635362 RepID=UPI001BEC309B|nr:MULTISPECIES: MmcQ/YjbR family DNA-binding protein [unclassified Lysobacter]MBT2746021.1 MmcQ/YjbR family DNA-binding protein [Lysobacter sp. ISL-42]MBT2752456.1 MmcQ/YjbR family DNA-binding protein [Lysobacter sp. ISL-50]MBT2776815.1 MmcQ/YjbR family DNA-binding protein [Lysobacter sp. ISL-54]MBT2780617.1 MmcQ/YjbR family DNA-binding protein [Lysobacter sp. ISL-52]